MAKKQYDFSAFDKPAPTEQRSPAAKQYDFSAFDQPAEKSTLDNINETAVDALRGAAQGATFGFADELAGGLGAAGDVLSGQTPLENIVDAYRQNRDSARKAFKESEERSPTASMLGNLAGGLAPALLTAGAAAPAAEAGVLSRLYNAGKIGAKAGLVGGLGTSDADLTKGDVLQAAKDTAVGGALGGATGLAVQGGIESVKGVKNLVKMLGQTGIGQDIGKAYNYGKEGVDLVTKEGLEKAEEGARDASKALGFGSKEALKDAGTEVGAAKKALSQSGKTFDVSDEINQIKDLIGRLKDSDNPDAIKDVEKLQGYLDNLLLGKEVETPVSYTKFTPGKAIEAKPSARDALELEAMKSRASAKALGQDLNTTIVPSEDESGNKLLTLLKHSDEQVGASERAIPVRDAEGNVISHQLDEGDLANNFKTKASAKTVLDTPAVEGGFAPSERGPVVTETTKYRPGGVNPDAVGFDKASDIQSTLNNFNGVKGGSPKLETQEAVNQLKQSAKSLGDKLSTASTDLTEANTKYAASKQSMDILGIDNSDFIKDAATGQQRLTVQGEQKLNNIIKRMARDTDAGENASNKMTEALRLLERSDPQKAEALKPVVNRASEILDLSQKAQRLGLLNKSTYVKSGGVNVGNIAGRTVKNLSDATPDQLKGIAQDLLTKGAKGMRLAQNLADAMKKDNVGRNAALFALQQNPEYRELLRSYSGGTDEGK